jgi:hypothetical protein
VSPNRELVAARRFFAAALGAHGEPAGDVTDLAASLERAIEERVPNAFHNTGVLANNWIECDHGKLEARLRPMPNETGPNRWPRDQRPRLPAEPPTRPPELGLDADSESRSRSTNSAGGSDRRWELKPVRDARSNNATVPSEFAAG